MRIHNLYTDAKGESHFRDIEIEWAEEKHFSKMSKRFGNITTPRDLRTDGVEAAAIRLMMLQTHYRQQFDLTDEGRYLYVTESIVAGRAGRAATQATPPAHPTRVRECLTHPPRCSGRTRRQISASVPLDDRTDQAAPESHRPAPSVDPNRGPDGVEVARLVLRCSETAI